MSLKSIYIMVYIMGANTIAVWSVYQLYAEPSLAGYQIPRKVRCLWFWVLPD